MAALQLNPFDQFADQDGLPLNGGYIYVGQPNADPRQFPVTVYYDAAMTIPAVQPLRTNGGYVIRNGAPALVYLSGDYSLMVLNKKGIQVFYIASYSAIVGTPSTPFVEQTYTAYPATGAAPAYVLTPSPALTVYKTNQRFNITFPSAGTTGSNTLNINGLGVKNLKQYDSAGVKQPAVITAGMIADVVYDGVDQVVLDSLPAVPYSPPVVIGVRQAIQSGPTTGTPPVSDLIPQSQLNASLATGLTLNPAGTVPVLYSVANGYAADGSPNNLNWLTSAPLNIPNLPANTTGVLWIDPVAHTGGSSPILDTEQDGGTIPITSGKHTFDSYGMKMYLGNGAAAVQSNRLIVADFVTDATKVVSISCRAYRLEYYGDFQTPLSANGILLTRNSNLGTPNNAFGYVECNCITSDQGFSAGQRLTGVSGLNASSATNPMSVASSRNTALAVTGNSIGWYASQLTTGSAISMTVASWSWRFVHFIKRRS